MDSQEWTKLEVTFVENVYDFYKNSSKTYILSEAFCSKEDFANNGGISYNLD